MHFLHYKVFFIKNHIDKYLFDINNYSVNELGNRIQDHTTHTHIYNGCSRNKFSQKLLNLNLAGVVQCKKKPLRLCNP